MEYPPLRSDRVGGPFVARIPDRAFITVNDSIQEPRDDDPVRRHLTTDHLSQRENEVSDASWFAHGC